MKYYKIEFHIDAPDALMQDARDILAALLGEADFETFEETPSGLTGYVQRQLLNEETLNTQLAQFPFEDTDISYEIQEADDKNWNEQWEQEGFEPIVISGKLPCPQREASVLIAGSFRARGTTLPQEQPENERMIIVHDGRHLPAELTSQLPVPTSCISIEIDAHLAFGTGNHETTRMMVSTLLSLPLAGRRVLDCGCGTGILGIAALKLGACNAVGYDIDEWSAENARHNAVINGVDGRFTSLLGDASILKEVEGTFDVVLANINRNILLADMPAFCQKMTPDGSLVLSGFYTADIPLLTEEAEALGLVLTGQKTEGDWACIVLRPAIHAEPQADKG